MRKKITDAEKIKRLKKECRDLKREVILYKEDLEAYKEHLHQEMKDKAIADVAMRNIRSLFIGLDLAYVTDREIKILQILSKAGTVKLTMQELGYIVRATRKEKPLENISGEANKNEKDYFFYNKITKKWELVPPVTGT